MELPNDRLVSALLFDHLDIAEEEIAKGVNVNGTVLVSEPTGEREPILFRASRSSAAVDAVELLLKHGANPNARDDAGDTLLIALAGSGTQTLDCVTLVRRLLEAGVDINATDKGGLTALDRAITMTHSMLQQPRAIRSWDSPDLVVSLFILDLLEANGAKSRRQESLLKRSEIRAMAERDKRIGPGGQGRS